MKTQSRRLFCRLVALLTLASWAAAADSYPRQEAVDILHYRFELQLSDQSDEIIGRTLLKARFASSSNRDLQLDLIEKKDGASPKGMTVSSVLEDGRETAFTHREGRLSIRLRKPSQAGEERTYQVDYRGVPADGLLISENKYGERTFFADNWPDRARHWLPVIDHPYDKATCEFIVTAPQRYQVVANGALLEETGLAGGLRRTHWRTAAPLATKVMVIGAARFAVQHLETRRGQLPIQSWVFPQDQVQGFRDLAQARGVVDFFESLLGPFPYAKLANVQSRTRFGGVENAGSIFYAENAFQEQGDEPANLGLIAHEVAHQWFGDSVTEADWNHVWLSEGFATYLAGLYMEHRLGSGHLSDIMNRARRRIIQYTRRQPHATVVEQSVDDLNSLLNPISYQKGAWVLHMLRRQMGDQAFRAGLKAFYRRFRDSNAVSTDFQQVMEEQSGKALGGFFRQWLHRPAYPKLKVLWSYQQGTLELSVDQTSPGDPFMFEMDVEVPLQESRPPFRQRIRIEQKQSRFSWSLPAPPKNIVLDPDVWLLMEAEVESKN